MPVEDGQDPEQQLKLLAQAPPGETQQVCPAPQVLPAQQSAGLVQVQPFLVQHLPPAQVRVAPWKGSTQHSVGSAQALPFALQQLPPLQPMPAQQSAAAEHTAKLGSLPQAQRLLAQWLDAHSASDAQPAPALTRQRLLMHFWPPQQVADVVHDSFGSPQMPSQVPLLQLPEQQSENTAQEEPLTLHFLHVPR